mgnify:CR=1 FL=1
MKKSYAKPQAAVETFEVNTSIASGCQFKVNLGPGDPDKGYQACDGYDPGFDISLYAWQPGDHMGPVQTNFYPDTCDCYLDAGEGAMFTS